MIEMSQSAPPADILVVGSPIRSGSPMSTKFPTIKGARARSPTYKVIRKNEFIARSELKVATIVTDKKKPAKRALIKHFKYTLLPGNNSRAILAEFRKRLANFEAIH